MKPHIYLALPMGCPTGNDYRAILAWANNSTRRYEQYDVTPKVAIGGYTYATLWAEALNMGCSDFFMIHTDVVPRIMHHVDRMWDLREQWRQERGVFPKILATVLALKDDLRYSSTGWEKLYGGAQGTIKLTLEETDALPEMFSIKDLRPEDTDHYALSINCGLMLCDLRPDPRKWYEQVEWVSAGGIRHIYDTRGRRISQAHFHSEDYLESRKLHGILEPDEIVAHHAFSVLHYGWFGIDNTAIKEIKCRVCRDTGLVDANFDTQPCPMCQAASSAARLPA